MLLAQTAAPSWHESVTFLIAVFGAGLSLYNAWTARGSRRASLRQEAPYFVFPEILVLLPVQPDGRAAPNSSFNYPPGGAVPANHPNGAAMLFRMTNKGGEARFAEVHVDSNIPDARGEYQALKDRSTLHLYYRNAQQRHGKWETFRISYETISGHKGEQTFQFLHAGAEVKRLKIR